MDLEARFEALWNRLQDFALPEDQPIKCVFARRFWQWTNELCTKVAQEPNIVFVNQAKVLLIDKYFEWRSAVPRSHRNRLSNDRHGCIFQVFSEAYERLKIIELSLTPPMLFLPPPPPPLTAPSPSPPQIAGIFIGEKEE